MCHVHYVRPSPDNPILCVLWQEMRRVCKRDGTIRLLEHGRAHYDLINAYLDARSVAHVKASPPVLTVPTALPSRRSLATSCTASNAHRASADASCTIGRVAVVSLPGFPAGLGLRVEPRHREVRDRVRARAGFRESLPPGHDVYVHSQTAAVRSVQLEVACTASGPLKTCQQ